MTESLVLGDSLEALIDHRGKTPRKLGTDFALTGVPVASAILVKNGRLDLAEARCVEHETWQRWMGEMPTRAGDVLLTSEAPLGRVARVETDAPLVLGQRLYGLRGRPGVLDSGYLYYALQTDRVQADLLGRSTGTTVFGIRQSALRQVMIPAPTFPEQRAIAEVLGALDDKIAANQQEVATVEALMIALATRTGQRARVQDLASHSTRSLRPSEFPERVAHFSLPAFDQGDSPEEAERDSIKSNKFLLDEPCVLMSKLNPRIPRIWNVGALPPELSVASTEFVVLKPRGISPALLWSVLSSPHVSAQLESLVAGTSGSHQRVRPVEMLDVEVANPRALDESIQDLISALGALAHGRRLESRQLAKTRDELLPLLMSGKVRIGDLDETTSEGAKDA